MNISKVLTVDDLTDEEFRAVLETRESKRRWFWCVVSRRELIHEVMGHEILWADGGSVGMYVDGCSCGADLGKISDI